jgi:GrpB-like predicted nucleotidyltransferase (UPF0157 family)
VVDGKVSALVRAVRLTRDLERSCHDPREAIASKVRRMQRTKSPDLPPRVRALCSYDPAWPSRFADEERRIRAALGDAVARVEHFGSTSIRAEVLSAKNVIDFLVAIREPSLAPEARAVLAALGYTSYGSGPCDPETEWWWRIEEEAAFVAHLCEAANPWIDTVVNYRDYMRAHPEECVRYEEVKRRLATEPDCSLFEYSLGKLRLFYEISGKADAWKEAGQIP